VAGYRPIGLPSAVSINGRNLDLLCEDDCGAWGQLVMTRLTPVRRGMSRPAASPRRVSALLILHLRLKSPSTINWPN
jgi:hypothetical protein